MERTVLDKSLHPKINLMINIFLKTTTQNVTSFTQHSLVCLIIFSDCTFFHCRPSPEAIPDDASGGSDSDGVNCKWCLAMEADALCIYN
jgi:hypothetical protein